MSFSHIDLRDAAGTQADSPLFGPADTRRSLGLRHGMRIASLMIAVSAFFLTGCGSSSVAYPYSSAQSISAFTPVEGSLAGVTGLFARDIAITPGDEGDVAFETQNDRAAGLFDVDGGETMIARNIHNRVLPASTTKVLTALVALKNSDLDEKITASGTAAGITESGATLLGLKAGDTMTMDQALNCLLICSANDVAVAIAEHVGGSVAGFADMMNEEAKRLGATNSNFKNPHGLQEDDHYTTAYDLYLIFNEAIKHQHFVDIISQSSYKSVYYDRQGASKDINIESTNLYIRGGEKAPDNITVKGGKTGTTKAAGSNLIMLSEDEAGNQYISVVMFDDSRELLYKDMTVLLEGIGRG